MVLLTMLLNPPCAYALCRITLELLLPKKQHLFCHLTTFDLGFGHLTCFGQYNETEVTACWQLSAQTLTCPGTSVLFLSFLLLLKYT